MTVKRWNNWCGVTHGHRMQEQPGGLYVTFEDYDALAARLAEAVERAENAEAAFEGSREMNKMVLARLADLQSRFDAVCIRVDQVTDTLHERTVRLAEAEALLRDIKTAWYDDVAPGEGSTLCNRIDAFLATADQPTAASKSTPAVNTPEGK